MRYYKLEQWVCCQLSTKINNFGKPYCQIRQLGYLQFYLNAFPVLKYSFYSFTMHLDIITSLNAQVVHSVFIYVLCHVCFSLYKMCCA